MRLPLQSIIGLLLAISITYFAAAYAYLAWWHREPFLWSRVVHENGCLTLAGSLFYFDHFLDGESCFATVFKHAIKKIAVKEVAS
jgi:hypothetical protein